MNKVCTSLEQSKKLVELGIDVNTADMFYADLLVNDNHKYIIHPLESYGFKTFEETKLKTSKHLDFISAWSLSALFHILPFQLIVNNKIYKFGMSKGFNKSGETYAIKYSIFNTTFYLHLTNFYNNPIDAAFEMVCWLLENNKL